MNSILLEGKQILFKLLTLILIAPIIGYGVLFSTESLIKAWKTNNRFKKWLAITGTIVFLAIVFGWLQ